MPESSPQPPLVDRLKVEMIVRMRKAHQRTLEHSSRKSFRKRVVAASPPPRLVPAARVYKNVGWLPTNLLAAERMPKEAALPLRYNLPYYGVGKLGWAIYGKAPVDPSIPWSPGSSWNRSFPPGEDEWGDPSEDSTFTALRLQGPNPFMLTKVEPDVVAGDGVDTDCFALDFTDLFDGVLPATVARFEVKDDLVATRIHIGEVVHRPGEDGWDNAKRVVNALDARYSAFVRHLLNSHLMVGQAYALAAYALPVWHPLREFMDFFTYGTAMVNNNAYKALFTEDSYFLRSNFLTPEDARKLIENASRLFDFDEWLVPRDLEKRGIEAIPDHPYVEDAKEVWPAIVEVVDRHLTQLDITDDDVRSDNDLIGWYWTLRRLLPDADNNIPTLESRADLAELMTALIYNNVIHEVCGNISPILDSRDPEDKMAIDINHLRMLAAGEKPPPPSAGSVFLMDQAAFVSRFNVAGNNLMTINAARFIDDPKLRVAVEDLQGTLRELEATLVQRNAKRDIPFRMMQPTNWEASVSF